MARGWHFPRHANCMLALMLLGWALCIAACMAQLDTRADGGEEKFILPILIAGPNNQKRDLRNYLALGRELDRRVILTGIQKHHFDKGVNGNEAQLAQQLGDQTTTLPQCFDKPGYMPMERVLDVDSMKEEFGALTYKDAIDGGWDGVLDAFIYPSDFEHRIRIYARPLMQATGVDFSKAARIPINFTMIGCDDDILDDLYQIMKPYKYVALFKVNLGRHINPNLIAEQRTDVSTLKGCEKSLAEGNRALHVAPWLKDVGDRFIKSVIGSTDFMCIHARPYPDTCLDAWKDGDIQAGIALSQDICHWQHTTLHDRIGSCAVKRGGGGDTTRIFVMTHPMIRHQVQRLLSNVGIHNASYADPHLLKDLVGCIDHSPSFIAMVEESICAQAKHFIGTHQSSISQSLGFIRLGTGLTDNAYFESLHNC